MYYYLQFDGLNVLSYKPAVESHTKYVIFNIHIGKFNLRTSNLFLLPAFLKILVEAARWAVKQFVAKFSKQPEKCSIKILILPLRGWARKMGNGKRRTAKGKRENKPLHMFLAFAFVSFRF